MKKKKRGEPEGELHQSAPEILLQPPLDASSFTRRRLDLEPENVVVV